MTYDGEHRVCYGGMFIGQYYIPDCRTVPGHGTQVEYYAPNGLAFLWYPGNHRPVPSRWKLEHKKNIYGTYLYAICFLYPSRSYNPLTHESGGDWECDELGHWTSKVTEVRDDDIFGLSTFRLPYTLSKQPTTFEALLRGIPDQ